MRMGLELGGDEMVIIGHRSSKSTFGANNVQTQSPRKVQCSIDWVFTLAPLLLDKYKSMFTFIWQTHTLSVLLEGWHILCWRQSKSLTSIEVNRRKMAGKKQRGCITNSFTKAFSLRDIDNFLRHKRKSSFTSLISYGGTIRIDTSQKITRRM